MVVSGVRITPEELLKVRDVEAVGADGARRPLTIVATRAFMQSVLVRFQGVDDVDQARELHGQVIEVDPARLPPAGDGTVYLFQLVGLSVVTEDGESLGKVADVFQTGATPILVVRGRARADDPHEPGHAGQGRHGGGAGHGAAPAGDGRGLTVRITVVTIFPDMFPAFLDEGMVRIAREQGLLDVQVVNLRDFTKDKHRSTDDAPVRRRGGDGDAGRAPSSGRSRRSSRTARSATWCSGPPRDGPFRQDDAVRLAGLSHVVVLCGRYKGVDERVAEQLVDEELSLGDFVLSGGEPFALCVVDAVARLLPGVLGDFDSAESDSFHSGLLDCAYYTRPAEFAGHRVPDVLLSGDHGKIARWRRENALSRTFERRPDLLTGAELDAADRKFIRALSGEAEPEAPARRTGKPRGRGAQAAPKETS